MKKLYLLFLFAIIFTPVLVKAQINAGNDTTICRFTSATLNAQVTNQPGATVYQFTTIPYSPEPFNGSAVSLGDDAVSGALPIGFQFCFIGNNYTQFYIGSNGWISFSSGQPTTYISQAIPSTNPNVPKNCIMAPWMDWDPSSGGNIYYKTIGTAPNRKLVISFVNVPLYGAACGSYQGTFQIVIEEGTNIINNYIQNKPVCPSGGASNGSLFATQGVHNINGTVAYTVPGRNNTQWTATNEGTQFFPTGPALFTVTWHNLAGTQVGTGTSFTVSPSNNTTYVAKVTYNCSQITYYDTVVVNVSPPIAATTTTVNASCNGATDGSATVNITGGSSPFTYSWSTNPPQTTATASNIPAGNYIVIVTDAIGCTAMKTAIVSQPPPILISITKNNPSCSGVNDGDATANVVGGVAPLTYNWSNGQITATATGLTTGTYTVTVTDNTGCTSSASVSLTAPPPFSISLNPVNPICNGGTGSITATPSGGFSPYTYAWSSGATGSTATGLPAGNYTVTITDSKGCNNTATATLTAPAAMTATATITDVNCAGANTGKITLNITNGTAPYTFNWSNNSTTNPAQNLTAGNYTVTVTDASGCTFTSSYTVSEPSPITINITNQNPTCSGANNGSLTATATGGTAPLTYSWSSGSNTAIAANLIAGNYTVTVTDAKGCTKTAQATLTDASAINVNLQITPISCSGMNDGSAFVAPTGGSGIASIQWSNGQSGNSISNLSTGTYTVSVTDNSGCIKTESFSLLDPLPMVLTFAKNNVSCFNGSDGNINLTVTNGAAPYSYNWSNGSTASSLPNLSSGSYSVTVTDNKGCTATSSVLVSQPTQIQSQVTSDSVLCNGGATGKATVTASGGSAPYSYLWSNGQNTGTATNLIASKYYITITDYKNCTKIDSAIVAEPDPISSTVVSVDETCVAANGSATVTALGGTAPYTYNWQNGSVTDSIVKVSTGNYRVTITDAKGCIKIDSAKIGRSGGITAQVIKKNITCFGFDDGSISLDITGATDPISYSWSNGLTDSVLTNLTKGTYAVTISDRYGCTDSVSAEITEPSLLTMNFTSNTFDASCFGFNDGAAEVEVNGGIKPYSYFWSTGDSTAAIQDLYADVYHIAVVDSNGCTISDSIFINQPDEIVITMMADTSLPFGNSVQIDASVIPAAMYNFTWTPAQSLSNPIIINPVAQPFETTTYILTVENSSTGCTVEDTLFIEVKDRKQFWIATAFSPNGDGINDYLEAKGNRLQQFNMSIYNRWGNLVYTTNDINMSWDGTINGEKMPGGVYMYKAFVIDEWGIAHTVAGSITLIR